MMYPFMTLDDNTEIVHSEKLSDGQVKVYFERPDDQTCFNHATCMLPSYKWIDVEGFSTKDINRFKNVVESCAHLIMEYSTMGEFDRASYTKFNC